MNTDLLAYFQQKLRCPGMFIKISAMKGNPLKMEIGGETVPDDLVFELSFYISMLDSEKTINGTGSTIVDDPSLLLS